MDAGRLQDRISRGMGSAARVIGEDYDLLRPRSAARPMGPENLIMRLPVILDGGDPGYRRPRGYDRALRATFDSIAVHVGDYLRGPRGVLFVAALPPLLFPLCMLTNVTMDVLRAGAPSVAGLNAYGGVVEDVFEMVLAGWPGQIIAEGSGKQGALPADGGQTGWSVVLPPTPVPIAASDVLQDGTGRRYLVRAVEESEMGWRLSVRGTEV